MNDEIINIGYNNVMESYVKTDDIINDLHSIINSSQTVAYKAVNSALIQRNWLIGYRIAEEELGGAERAEYGASVIANLAKELTSTYGKGFTKSNLYNFYLFYKRFPEIFHTASGKSFGLLSWSHYSVLLQVKDDKARNWYEREAANQTWSVRTLQRNVSSHSSNTEAGTCRERNERAYSRLSE